MFARYMTQPVYTQLLVVEDYDSTTFKAKGLTMNGAGAAQATNDHFQYYGGVVFGTSNTEFRTWAPGLSSTTDASSLGVSEREMIVAFI